MRTYLRPLAIGFVVLFFTGMAIKIWAPSPSTEIDLTFDVITLDENLDQWLEDKETAIPDLRANAEKQIVWHDDKPNSLTEYSVVYIHGFSASKVETAPVAQYVAAALGANLFLTRLAGHGRDGKAMAEATLSKWADDTAEAIAIGGKLGSKVVLITGSTGGTLATWAASKPFLANKVHTIVSISPNYSIHGASIGLLNMPWAETLLPLFFGDERSFEPSSKAHAEGWTHTYPSRAIFPMAALLKVVSQIDYSKITVPNLFIYSPNDRVVVSEETERVFEAWGGTKDSLQINNSNDPYNHVIAGDILSPDTTNQVSNAIIVWVNSLKNI